MLLEAFSRALVAVGDWATAMVADTTARAMIVKMRTVRWNMDSLLNLRFIHETGRQASAGPHLGQFRDCHRQRRQGAEEEAQESPIGVLGPLPVVKRFAW
jgi:hypothetical protein